jgi:hypothetical protein
VLAIRFLCRNVFSHVPSTRVRELSHMLKAIHEESREAADNKARAIVDDLRASKDGQSSRSRRAGRRRDPDPMASRTFTGRRSEPTIRWSGS